MLIWWYIETEEMVCMYCNSFFVLIAQCDMFFFVFAKGAKLPCYDYESLIRIEYGSKTAQADNVLSTLFN